MVKTFAHFEDARAYWRGLGNVWAIARKYKEQWLVFTSFSAAKAHPSAQPIAVAK
jgi:hypothetical protein